MSISCLVRSSIQCSTVGAAGGWWLVAVIMTQNKGPDSAVTASRHRHPDKTRVPFISIRVIQIFNVRSVFRQRNRKQDGEKQSNTGLFYILLSTSIQNIQFSTTSKYCTITYSMQIVFVGMRRIVHRNSTICRMQILFCGTESIRNWNVL